MVPSTKAYFTVPSFLIPLFIQHPHCMKHAYCMCMHICVSMCECTCRHQYRSTHCEVGGQCYMSVLTSCLIFLERVSILKLASVCTRMTGPCRPFHCKSHGSTYVYYHGWLYLSSGGSNADPHVCVARSLHTESAIFLATHLHLEISQERE